MAHQFHSAVENKEKIGFGSKNQEPVLKINKKSKISGHSIRILVLAILATLASFFLMNIQAFSVIFMIIYVLILIVIIIIPIMFTLGLILISDGFRAWIGNAWGTIDNLTNISSNLDKISPLFPYFGFTSLGLSILALLLAIIGRMTEKKRYIISIIFSIFCIIISAFLLFAFYKGGQKVFWIEV